MTLCVQAHVTWDTADSCPPPRRSVWCRRFASPIEIGPANGREIGGTATWIHYLKPGTRGETDILPLFLFVLAVTLVLGFVLVLAWYVGSKARHGGARTMPFESGIVPVGEAEDMRLSIEFYLIAVFFVIFDLETIFIIAWAVAFHDLGWRGYTGASIFIVLLLAALFYEWRTGALDWGVKRRIRGPGRYARAEAAETA